MSGSNETPPSRTSYAARLLQGGPTSVTLEFTSAREASPESRYRAACRASSSSDLSHLAEKYLSDPSVLTALGLENMPEGTSFADISDLVSRIPMATMIVLPIDVYEGNYIFDSPRYPG